MPRTDITGFNLFGRVTGQIARSVLYLGLPILILLQAESFTYCCYMDFYADKASEINNLRTALFHQSLLTFHLHSVWRAKLAVTVAVTVTVTVSRL